MPKWLVFNGKSQLEMDDDSGVALFQETSNFDFFKKGNMRLEHLVSGIKLGLGWALVSRIGHVAWALTTRKHLQPSGRETSVTSDGAPR